MRTYVYVDGLNLYYRALRRSPYKWLDLAALAQGLLLPDNQLLAIKYFTANVHPTPKDPGVATRQQIYLRALQTLPHLEVIKGTFLSHVVARQQTAAAPGRVDPRTPPVITGWVNVLSQEEKGSDANLAVHLLHDAHLERYDLAVVISNDSDLAEALRLVRTELKRKVGLLCPCNPASRNLRQWCTFVRYIDQSALASCQLPPTLTDSHGTIHKPIAW